MTRGATFGIRSCRLFVLIGLASGCGGGGGGQPPPPEPRPPSVTAVRLSESAVPTLLPGEAQILDVAFDYADPDSDLAHASVTVDEPGGPYTITVPLPAAQRSGTGEARLVLDARYAPGAYTVTVEVTDAGGLVGGPSGATFEVSAGAPAALAVSDLSPAAGRSGDRVVITGTGFVSGDLRANEVTFGNPLARAGVVSAAAGRLEVLVPLTATSGPVAVRNSSGARRSPGDFAVAHAITLAPASAQLVAGRSLQLTCLEAGVSAVDLAWTLNGSVSDPALGAVDARGLYTAPAAPPAAPVTVRCASRVAPAVFAEAVVAVVRAVGVPGSGTADPVGSVVRSAESDVAVTFPPGAVAVAAPFRVEALDPGAVPALSPDHLTLAAASFPDPVTLSADAAVAFALPSWVAPGTPLPLLEYDAVAGTVSDVGRVAVVDESGTKAVGAVDHFSGWAIAETMPASMAEAAADHLVVQGGLGVFFRPVLPPGLDFTEGLRVPFLVACRAGPGSGAGPFLHGVTARWRLADEDGGGYQIAGVRHASLVQPSGDGWSVGVVLQLPVLPSCGAGQAADAFLDLAYPKPGGTSGTLSLPFTIDCLDELVFDADAAPSPLPAGASHEVQDGQRIVTVSTDASYRFSRVRVGAGGVLRVREEWLPGGPLAFRMEVTGDVRIDGALVARGLNGAGGGDGSGSTDAGFGGLGGTPGGGHGGMGGPEMLSPPSLLHPYGVQMKRGHDGFRGYFPLGGPGGAGGARWDNASWLSLVVSGAEVVLSAGSVLANPTSFQSYYDLAANTYEFYGETVKIQDKEENRILSAGGGGRAGPASGAFEGPAWWVYPPFPRPGGGGGGSGKMEIEAEPDAAGGGGGGGGGAAPNIEIVAGGEVTFGPAGVLDGRGGSGNRGGDGSEHSWTNQAAPGGGGAGGSGAGLHVASRLGLRNDGMILLPGGLGNLGGEIHEDGGVILLASTFGEHGPGGEVRLDGACVGTCDEPATRGAWFHEQVAVSASATRFAELSAGSPAPPRYDPGGLASLFTQLVNGADVGGLADVSCHAGCPSDRVRASFPLEEGMNVLSLRRNDLGVEPHPWLRSYVFHFEGLGDADADGLTDGAEGYLGTSPTAADSDGDGLDDFDEAIRRHTNPLATDTDGDGFDDGLEVARGFDPLDPASHPAPLPTVVSTAPAAGATGVSALASISVTFSEPMDPGATTAALSPAAGLLPPEWSTDGLTVTLRPDPILAFATAYTLSVEGLDLEGYGLVGTKVFPFTTEGGAPPPLVANGTVYSFAAGPDGTVYLGGAFTRIGRRTGGGVPLDAVTAAVVEPFAEVAGYVLDAAADGAGGWWIAGDFSAVGGVARPDLAHVLADGTLAAFDAGLPELGSAAFEVSVGGGRVFVHGSFGVQAFDAATGAALWNAALGSIGSAAPLALAGSTLYVGGASPALVALDAGTGEVLPWDAGIDSGGQVYALAWTGSTLYVGGAFITAGGAPRASLAAFDATGTLTAWDPGPDSFVHALAWSGSTLYAGGSFTSIGGETRHGLAAFDAAGALTTWNPGEWGMYVAEVATDGSTVFVQGDVYGAGGEPRYGLAAFDLAGAVLPWAPRPVEAPSVYGDGALAVSGGAVFVGGDFLGVGGEERIGLAAVDVRGALLPWNPGGACVSSCDVALLGPPGGPLVLAVSDTLKAFDATTGALAWEVPYDNSVWSLASDGSIAYLGGQFQTVGGLARAGLAALDANGNVTAWDPGIEGIPWALAVRDGVVYAAGDFGSVGGEVRAGLAAIDASGAVTPWAPRVNGSPQALAPSPEAVYVGGVFFDVDGVPRSSLAAIDLSGALLPWAPQLTTIGSYGYVTALATAGSTVYVGGSFEWVNGVRATGLVAIDTSGAVLPWDRDTSGIVQALLVQGSRLWAGGDFASVGTWPAQGFAVLER